MGPPTLVPFPKLIFRRNLRAMRAATPIRAAPAKTAINVDLTATDSVDSSEFTSNFSSEAPENEGISDGILEGGASGDGMGLLIDIGLVVGIGLVAIEALGVLGKLNERSYMERSRPKSSRKSLEMRKPHQVSTLQNCF
jgi:hypothetical protein